MSNVIEDRIVEILKNNEESLSDGYGYYSGSRTETVLHEIAKEIIKSIPVCLNCQNTYQTIYEGRCYFCGNTLEH